MMLIGGLGKFFRSDSFTAARSPLTISPGSLPLMRAAASRMSSMLMTCPAIRTVSGTVPAVAGSSARTDSWATARPMSARSVVANRALVGPRQLNLLFFSLPLDADTHGGEKHEELEKMEISAVLTLGVQNVEDAYVSYQYCLAGVALHCVLY